MNLITTGAAPQTMTSREMADLTEKRHDSVKRTIDILAGKGVIGQPHRVDGEKSGNNTVEVLYLIGKRDSYVVVAQLSPEFTARLVDRWQELESAVADPLAGLPADKRALIGVMIENEAIKKEQAVQAVQIASQAEAIKRIESNQTAAVASVQNFTALGFSIYREIPMSKIELIRLGKRASAISKRKGITIDHVADGRHGRVGSYHISVLDAALEELTK